MTRSGVRPDRTGRGTTAIQPPGRGLSREARLGLGLGAIALAVLVYARILYYMVLHWKIAEEHSHGFLVAPLALYFAWERRRELARAPVEGSWLGVMPLALGATALAIGRLGVELMAMRTGFVLTLIGLVLLLFGREIFRILLFPLLFLFLMVPLPQSLLNVIAFPLQLIAAQIAVEGLHVLHVPALVEGNIVHLADSQLFVDQACSGLRSLMALITLGVVFAKFFCDRPVDRTVLVASTIPIAVLVNSIRVGLTGILAARYGRDAASGAIHDLQGVITFAVAFLVLLLAARALERLRMTALPYRARRRHA